VFSWCFDFLLFCGSPFIEPPSPMTSQMAAGFLQLFFTRLHPISARQAADYTDNADEFTAKNARNAERHHAVA
jgi:hypothetical protein